MVYLLMYVSKWLITIKKVRIPYSIHVKITSTAAPQGTQLATALLYVVQCTVHCRDTTRNSQRYLMDVGEKKQ